MRDIAKTGTYGVVHISVAFGVAYVLTNDWRAAMSISLIEPVVQMFTFFFHEKAWNKYAPVKVPAAQTPRA